MAAIMMKMFAKSFFRQPLMNRLLPLYVAAFSHGFVLWYAIEKLFMQSIGFTDATIGVMAAVYTIVTLLVETPSGILADRWSRKGVLLIASVLLVLATLLGGLSYNVPVYIVAMGLWGIFYALYSGTYESVVYDVLLEEQQSADNYEKWFGYVRFVDSIALALGALLGGLVSALANPRMTYFITIPFSLISVLALLRFREPLLHKAEPLSSVQAHVAATFASILKRRSLVPVLLVLLSGGLLLKVILEFNQLWWLALAAPIGMYGVATAANLGSLGLGGLLAAKLRIDKPLVFTGVVTVIIASAASLVFWRNFYAVVVVQMLLVTTMLASEIIFARSLHDELSSTLRAGAASAVSTFVSIIFIPFSLVFGSISNRHDTFSAAWMVLAIAIVMVLALAGSIMHRRMQRARLYDIVSTETPVK